MNRWVVKRMVALQIWARERGDRGQTSFEYLGIALVIAFIIAALATTDIGQSIKTKILAKITQIAGG